jgi:hypothetical protein
MAKGDSVVAHAFAEVKLTPKPPARTQKSRREIDFILELYLS